MKTTLLRSTPISATGILELLYPSEYQEKEEYGKDFPEGCVIGFHGHKRMGKSLSMVALAEMWHRYYKYPVIANFNCQFAKGIPESNLPGLSSGRLYLDETVEFPPELKDCVIMWDEVDRVMTSKRTMSLLSEFIENSLNQIGKRNIWMMWSIQNIQRINPHMFYHTDFVIRCSTRDHGRNVYWQMTDMNGTYGPAGRQVRTIFSNTGRVKKLYDHREIFDPMERLSVQIDSKSGAVSRYD